MIKNRRLTMIILWSLFATAGLAKPANEVSNQNVLDAIKKSTQFMIDSVSYKGGFVWQYLPDFSRQWGEIEARRTMCWTQGEGTPAMGDFFLDLYHLTKDEYYYQCAERVASALIWGQHPSGGWNYVFDFAGESSLKTWYETVGKNAWRLEEFQHYYGNCTFDDDASTIPARFLLRIYSEKNDPKFRSAVDKAVDFVLNSQYPIGGWPQRYPLNYEYSRIAKGLDYSHYITLNDGVLRNNVNFLIQCYKILGEKRLIDPIYRGMNCLLMLQQGGSQPGWADQYSLDFKPAPARTYEPRSMHPRTTGESIHDMMDFYQITGDKKFLSRLADAIAWLESTEIPADSLKKLGYSNLEREKQNGVIRVPRHVEIGTNLPLSLRRTGSNAINGQYFIYRGYSDALPIKIQAMKDRYQHLMAISVEEATQRSPFYNTKGHATAFSDKVNVSHSKPSKEEVATILSSLNPQGYWLVKLPWFSHVYREPTPEHPFGSENPNHHEGVSDDYDTSPFNPKTPIWGITTQSYMNNVSKLINYLYHK